MQRDEEETLATTFRVSYFQFLPEEYRNREMRGLSWT
jgi:hypothetical protein